MKRKTKTVATISVMLALALGTKVMGQTSKPLLVDTLILRQPGPR